ncbi:MAG: HEAT repeat domain-containing protein [Acidobacteriota bacterium]|nr:HEAT repeat domain-containing protein [Acidobacteriota bacterium]
MRRSMLLFVLFATTSLFAQQFRNATVNRIDAARGVGAAIASAPTGGWFAWSVPASSGSICCDWNRGGGCCGSCVLDSSRGFSIRGDRDDDDGPHVTKEMLIAVRIESGDVQRVRLFDAGCEIDGAGKKVNVLTNVTADASIDYLLSKIRNADREGEMVSVLALHASPRVVNELIALARRDPDQEVRRHAIFWLGQRAGEKAAGELRRAVDDDPNDEVKEHAVFAISQLPRNRAVPMLIDLATTNKSRRVRERAMFWLAQTGDPRALDVIEKILTK